MNFDPIAPFYRAIEALAAGSAMQRCRLAFLDEIPIPRKVLIPGEGHGRFLEECVRRFPDAEIVVVDSSARMLDIASQRADVSNVCFVHADLLTWDPLDGGYDLIV